MTHTMVKELDTIEGVNKEAIKRLESMLDTGLSMSQIGRELGVNKGLIPYVLDGGHSPTVLEALGLPVLEKRPVPVCMECGQIHTMHKTCSEDRRVQERYRKCADLNDREDLDELEEFAKDNLFDSWTDFCRYIVRYRKQLNGGSLRISFTGKYNNDV